MFKVSKADMERTFCATRQVERMMRNREYWMVIGLLGITAYLLWQALSA